MFLQKLTLGMACGLVLMAAGVVVASTFGGASAKDAPMPHGGLTPLVPVVFPNGPAQGEAKPRVELLMPRWEKDIRAGLEKDAKLKALAAKHPLVVLHSREKYAGGGYKQACYSFIYESNEEGKHHNDVHVEFHNGGEPNTFQWNMSVGQQNLVVDLGETDFAKDPDPSKISIEQPGVLTGQAKAVVGHVYLERVRDSRGNNFYVVFQIVAVDADSRYMAFLWRKLPGGKVVKE